jgi:hypothetical protein
MSGADSGPSAATMAKWSKRQRQDWQQKQKKCMQRESTARAAEGARPKAPIQLPALTTHRWALFHILISVEETAGLHLDASFCSPTRSCGPPSGQWSKPAGTRRCVQCDVSHWGDTPG